MHCPTHVGTAMIAVQLAIPRFVWTDDNGRGKRRKRLVWRCPIPRCPQVKEN